MYLYMGDKVCYDVSNKSFRPEEGIVAIGANASHEWLAILTQWHIQFRRCDHSVLPQMEHMTNLANVELETQTLPEEKRYNFFAFPWSKAENECSQELLWHSTRRDKLIVAAQRRILFLCLNESVSKNESHYNNIYSNNDNYNDIDTMYNYEIKNINNNMISRTNNNDYNSNNEFSRNNSMSRTKAIEQTHHNNNPLHLSVEHELKTPSGLTMSVLQGNNVFFVLLTTTGVVYTVDWTNYTILHEWSTRILRKELLPCDKETKGVDSSLSSTSFAEKEVSVISSRAFSEDEECKRDALTTLKEECQTDDHDRCYGENVCEGNKFYCNREHTLGSSKYSNNSFREYPLRNYGQRRILPPGSAVHRIKQKSVFDSSDTNKRNFQCVLASQKTMMLPKVAAPHFIYFHSSPTHALHDTSSSTKVLSGAIIHVTFSAALSLFAMVLSSGAIVLVEYKTTQNYSNTTYQNITINYDVDNEEESEKSVTKCKYRCGVNVLPSVASIASINATHHLLVYCTLNGEVVCASFTMHDLHINETLLWRSSCALSSLSSLSKSITSITWMSLFTLCKDSQEQEKLLNNEEESVEEIQEEMCCVCFSDKTFALWHYSGVCTFCSTPLSSSTELNSANKVTIDEKKSIQNELTDTRIAIPATGNSSSSIISSVTHVNAANADKEQAKVSEHLQNSEYEKQRSLTESYSSSSEPNSNNNKSGKIEVSKSEYLLLYEDSLHQCLYLSVCQSHLLYTFSLGRVLCTASQTSYNKYKYNTDLASRTAEVVPPKSICNGNNTTITIMERNTLHFTQMESTNIHKRYCLNAETHKFVANCTNYTTTAHLPQNCYPTYYPIRNAVLNPFNKRFVICTAGQLTSDAQIIIYDRANDKWHLLSERIEKICESSAKLCSCLPVWLDTETCVFAVAMHNTKATTETDKLERQNNTINKKADHIDDNDNNDVVVEEEKELKKMEIHEMCTGSSFSKTETCQREFALVVCQFCKVKFDVLMCVESRMSSRPVHLSCVANSVKEVHNSENLFSLMCVDAERTLHIFSIHIPKDTNKQYDLQYSNSKVMESKEHKEDDNTYAAHNSQNVAKLQVCEVARLRLPESLHNVLCIWPVAINTHTNQAHLLVHRRQVHDIVQVKLCWNATNNSSINNSSNLAMRCEDGSNVSSCYANLWQDEHLSSSWVYKAWLDFNTPLEGVVLITHDRCGFTFYHLPTLLTSESEITNFNSTNDKFICCDNDNIDIDNNNNYLSSSSLSRCWCTVELLTTNSLNVPFSSSDLLCPITLNDHKSSLIGIKSFAIGTEGTMQHNADLSTQYYQDTNRKNYTNDANRLNSTNSELSKQRNCFASVSYKACILSSILASSPAGNAKMSTTNDKISTEQEKHITSTSDETSDQIFISTPSIRVVSSATLTWLRGQHNFITWIDQLCHDGSFVSLMDYFIHSLIVDNIPAGIPNLHREAALHAFVLFLRNYDAFYTIIAGCLRKMDSKGWDTFRDYVGSPVELFVECMELNKVNEAVQLLRRVLLDDVVAVVTVNESKTRKGSHELITESKQQTATNCALQLITKLISQSQYHVAYDVVRFMSLLYHHWELLCRDGDDDDDNVENDYYNNINNSVCNDNKCNMLTVLNQNDCEEEEEEKCKRTSSSHTASVNSVTSALLYTQKIVASLEEIIENINTERIVNNADRVCMYVNEISMPLRHDKQLVSQEETWHKIYETYPLLLECIGTKSQELYLEGRLFSLMSLLHTFGFDTLTCLHNVHNWTHKEIRCAKMETLKETSAAISYENKCHQTRLNRNVCTFTYLHAIMKGLYADLHLPLSTTRVSAKIAKLYRVNIKHVIASLKEKSWSSECTQCKEEWLLWLQQSTQSFNWTLPQCVLYGADEQIVHLLMTVRTAMEDDLCYQLALSLLLMDKTKLIQLICVHIIEQSKVCNIELQRTEPKMESQHDKEETANNIITEEDAHRNFQNNREVATTKNEFCTNGDNVSDEVSASARENSNSNNNINEGCDVKLSTQEATLQACKREILEKISLLEQVTRQAEFAGYHTFVQDVIKSLPPLLLENAYLSHDHAEEVQFIVSDNKSS